MQGSYANFSSSAKMVFAVAAYKAEGDLALSPNESQNDLKSGSNLLAIRKRRTLAQNLPQGKRESLLRLQASLRNHCWRENDESEVEATRSAHHRRHWAGRRLSGRISARPRLRRARH